MSAPLIQSRLLESGLVTDVHRSLVSGLFHQIPDRTFFQDLLPVLIAPFPHTVARIDAYQLKSADEAVFCIGQNQRVHSLSDNSHLTLLTTLLDQDLHEQIHKVKRPDWLGHHLNDHSRNSSSIGKILPYFQHRTPLVIHPRHLLSSRSFLFHQLTFEKPDQCRSNSNNGVSLSDRTHAMLRYWPLAIGPTA